MLGQRRLYILPLWPGVGLFFGVLLMLFASINYGMNTGFMFSFMIVGYGIVAILMTNLNLYGLRLKAQLRQPAVFCGDTAWVAVSLSNARRSRRYAIAIGRSQRLQMVGATFLNVAGGTSISTGIPVPTRERGWLTCPLIQVETAYPFGLFRVWGFWNPAVQILVYPKPEVGAPPIFSSQGAGSDGRAIERSEGHDLAGIRAYRPGDSQKHLAWRQIARTDGFSTGQLYTKDHEGESSLQLRFVYDDLPAAMGAEQRLSRLTAWTLAAHAAGASYCVDIPGATSAMGSGEGHLAHCLNILALYEKNEGA